MFEFVPVAEQFVGHGWAWGKAGKETQLVDNQPEPSAVNALVCLQGK